MGVVKADGYGHGLPEVAQRLVEGGIHCLGVSHVYEALQIREAGIHVPVSILSGLSDPEEYGAVVAHGLIPMLFDLRAAEGLDQEASRQDREVLVHVKVDTGMGRLGVPLEGLRPFLEALRRYRRLRVEGLGSHFSSADEEDTTFTLGQIARFEEAIAAGRDLGFDLKMNHLANSAGILRYPGGHFTMVRPGIVLFGALPNPTFRCPLPLYPAMTFKARVLQVREVPECTPISYGRRYHTPCASRIAILSAGYGAGIPRGMSDRGWVLIRGGRCPILGTVCMNHTMCDITGVEGVTPGEEAVFLGSQGKDRITADEMAGWAGTIAYEVLCSLGQRNTRIYT